MPEPLLPLAEEARRAAALRALPLLDLTDLSDGCTETDIDRLCARAVGPHGPVAAVCVRPRFVARARAQLAGTPVRVATVVNFPDGGTDTAAVVAEAAAALRDGADEIDTVLPYRALAAGDLAAVDDQLARLRALCTAPVRLKVILETGRLGTPDLIRHAAERAIAAGADFVKTSTGKVEVNATPEAAAIMLEAIRDSGGPCGFKAAGGIRTAAEAGRYLALADRIMGPDWAGPDTVRFGASGLLDDLLAHLGGAGTAPPSVAY